MPVYRAEGIVLRRVALGEADRLVTLYTREHGKLYAVARGARKPTSRLGGRVEPYTHLRALLASGRSLDILTQVEVVEPFGALRTDLQRMAYAAYAVELVDKATATREPHAQLFHLLIDTLRGMCNGDPEVAALRFSLRLLILQGYRPSLDRCVGCGRSLGPFPRFSTSLGGVLCRRCGDQDPGAWTVDGLVLAGLKNLLRGSRTGPGPAMGDPGTRERIRQILIEFAENQLETHLQAPRVIRRLEGTEKGNRGRPSEIS
ncbi:MAG: DNA repair protein RecO [Armatimonadota bacterium]|nr:DNA repair protein RecO [Armatimonadota bacterium]